VTSARTHHAPTPSRRPSPFLAIYRLLLRMQLTKARLFGLAALGALAVLIALVIRGTRQSDPTQTGAALINEYGLWLLVPITALLLASATLGEVNDEGSLVYLWLRPVARWQLATAALLSSLTVALPLTLLPLLAAALLVGASSDLTIGVLVVVPLTLFAYCGAFCAVGLRSRRSVIWGLAYIFIVEGFVARGGESLAKLGIRSYGASLLSDLTGKDLEPFDVISPPWTWLVPAAVGVLGIVYAVRRLHVQDIP
jgi:ABC-2 type transport system permease protein